MTQTRKTYKTRKQQPKKHSSITFRVTEEERTQIKKHAIDIGCRTESEYLRILCHLKETDQITIEELQMIITDTNSCREWIKQHKGEINTAITVIHIAVKLLK